MNEQILSAHERTQNPSLEEILESDCLAREAVRRMAK